jgi:hypothetical protein
MPLPEMDDHEPNWPKWFLAGHAIELAINAFIIYRKDAGVPKPRHKERLNHDLVALYDDAVRGGLKRNPLVTRDLPALSKLHQEHYARYPKELKPVEMIRHFDPMLDQLIDDVGKSISVRL